MAKFWVFLLCGLALLLAGVAQLVGNGSGHAVFGVPLVVIGVLCVIASLVSRFRTTR